MSPLRRRLAVLVTAALVWTTTPVLPSAGAAPPTPAEAAPARGVPHDPATYYAGTEGLTGADLAARLHDIVKGHTKLSYTPGVWDALEVLDRDPSAPSRIIDFYSGASMLATCRSGSGGACDGVGVRWNREHTWPQSHGNFGTTAGAGTDLHHMRPSYETSNSSRGNLDYDETTGGTVPQCAACTRDSDSFEPREAVKGDVARGLFYMAVRYEGDNGELNFKLNDRTCNGSGPANMGKLSTLISWSLADPPDAGERARNDLIDGDYQGNRNPFIDHPEWVTAIFGNGVGAGPACGSTSGTEYLPGGTKPTNRPPTTAPMSATTLEDTATTVTLTASDPDGDPLAWTVTQTPTRGTAGVSGSTLTYTPAADAHGTDTVGVTVSDGRGETASTTVTITVTPVNDPPTTAPMTATTAEDTAVTVPLSATDVDGDPLTWSVPQQPARGTASINGTTLTYTPARDLHGTDTVGVTVSDGRGGTASTTVTVTVTPVNDPPTAADLSAATARDTPVQVALAGADVDDTALTYVVVSEPGHGSVSIAGATVSYAPAAGYTGPDSFTYRVSDPAGATSTPATVSITVTPGQQAPVATAVTRSTPEDQSTTFTLTATDPDGDPLTYAVADPPAHGDVALSGDQATYTPEADYHGPDAFTWSVTDGSTTVTSTASLTVTPVADRPVASGAAVTTPEDTPRTIALVATDADGDALTYAVAAGPQHGTVELDGATATYSPAADFHGSDSFTFTASDGTLVSTPATVAITVTPVNDPPVAAVLAATTPEDTAVTLTLSATDVDGDQLTYAIASGPGHGTLGKSGASVTYRPAANFHGTDTFTFTASDGLVTTTGTATITVTPVNDPPTAGPTTVAVDQDGEVTISLLGSDVDGDPLTYAVTRPPTRGTVRIEGETAVYTPAPGRTGADSFDYTASDGSLTSAPARVSVTVRPVNRPPVLSVPDLTTTAGTPVTTTLAPTDPDGDTVTITAAPGGLGTVTVNGLALTYTPTARQGTDSFTVTASDGKGATTTAQVGVTIEPRTATVTLRSTAATRGRAVTTTVTVAGPTGPSPTGMVTLVGGGVDLGTATLRPDGTAAVTWTPRRAGATSLVARFAGDALFAPAASASAALQVARSASRVVVTPVGTLRRNRPGSFRVTVTTVAGTAATGKVNLVVGSRTLTATLTRGAATIRVARLPNAARATVTARYAGDGQYLPGSARKTVTLRR